MWMNLENTVSSERNQYKSNILYESIHMIYRTGKFIRQETDWWLPKSGGREVWDCFFFDLCRVFIALHRPSLVSTSRGHSSWQCVGFPLQWLLFGTSGKEPACRCRRHKMHGFNTWVGKIPWSRKWQPTPVFLPGESHEQRNLADYGP